MALALRYLAHSEIGLVRKNNQDSAYISPTMLIVADGMGGADRVCLTPLPVKGGGGRCARRFAQRLQRRIPVGGVHVRRQDDDTVALGIAHDLGRRVEAHRLGIEQRRAEDIRVVALEPG